ncbi:MAG: hypothetical protein P8099_09430 [Gemmatimonadota bacterium]|jgi:hypothetical protein
MAREAESTVLLSDPEAGPDLAAQLAPTDQQVAWFGSVEEMVRARPLSSVAVLVLRFRPLPKGVLLAALGRMSVEYPEMQKVVVVDSPPPLPIAEYLTACGVDLYWEPRGGGGGDLEALVERLHERTRWVAT